MTIIKSQTKNMSSPKMKGLTQVHKIALLLLLILIISIGAIPGYFSGNWSWADLPEIKLNQLRELRKTSLNIPGWQTLDNQEIEFARQKWSAQLIRQNQEKPILLLLMPQIFYLNKPEVEWVNINGFEKWTDDSHQKLKFTINYQGKSVEIPARFFRGWNKQKTYAVVQWYSWPGGGSFAPSDWFWRDQWAQLQGGRVPWIAVSARIPMEPLGDIESVKAQAESLAKKIQETLDNSVFMSYEIMDKN